jgi:hypothetical protein
VKREEKAKNEKEQKAGFQLEINLSKEKCNVFNLQLMRSKTRRER